MGETHPDCVRAPNADYYVAKSLPHLTSSDGEHDTMPPFTIIINIYSTRWGFLPSERRSALDYIHKFNELKEHCDIHIIKITKANA